MYEETICMVAGGTIRERILKVEGRVPQRRGVGCCRGDDPREDTERGRPDYLPTIIRQVAEGTIRRRILKRDTWYTTR
jgi:hypothetical protein